MTDPCCGLSIIFCGFISHLIGREKNKHSRNFLRYSWFNGKRNLFIYLFLSCFLSFLCSFIHLFIHSFVCSFVHLFVCSFIRLFIRSFFLYLRNRKHVPCFYRVIQTQVEVWENKKCCGNTSRRRVFPQLFRVLPNFHECLYNSIETPSTCFLFLLENTRTSKRKTTC